VGIEPQQQIERLIVILVVILGPLLELERRRQRGRLVGGTCAAVLRREMSLVSKCVSGASWGTFQGRPRTAKQLEADPS
jgi:hypothetical protein